jgi:hypothetical protein
LIRLNCQTAYAGKNDKTNSAEMTTIYARTERGQQIAYDPQSDIPRKLRSILKVIDGKTAVSVYERNLGAFGDVRGMLRSLSMAGLITAIPEGSKRVRVNGELSDAERNSLMQPQAADEWSATRTGLSMNSRQFRPTQSLDVPTMTMSYASDMNAQLKQARALQSATDSMANFVLTHMPGQSFEILKELEGLTSLEMLAVTLSGYELMISRLGPVSTEHIRTIKQVLRENL